MADLAFDTLKTLGGYKGGRDGVEPPLAEPPPSTDVPAPPDAATGQPGPATMPSGASAEGTERVLAPDERLIGCFVELDRLWYERLKLLAGKAGVDPTAYVEGLIKTKWVLGPMNHPTPR
jgi:hypothetical protein